MKFDTYNFSKSVKKTEAQLQRDKINEYFTWRSTYIYDSISLNYS